MTPKQEKSYNARVEKFKNALVEVLELYTKHPEVFQVSISGGNSKMGEIPSVSLMPILTCGDCKNTCGRKCYAAKLANIRKSVMYAYARNTVMWEQDPHKYFSSVEKKIGMSRYFRFHVSGDIPNRYYFKQMIQIARNNTHCEILVFTKKWFLVNHWIKENGLENIPKNLHIIFSAWGDFKPVNTYNLPVAEVVFKGSEPLEDWKVCGGNCTDCACRGVGCWTLKQGETICFKEH